MSGMWKEVVIKVKNRMKNKLENMEVSYGGTEYERYESDPAFVEARTLEYLVNEAEFSPENAERAIACFRVIGGAMQRASGADSGRIMPKVWVMSKKDKREGEMAEKEFENEAVERERGERPESGAFEKESREELESKAFGKENREEPESEVFEKESCEEPESKVFKKKGRESSESEVFEKASNIEKLMKGCTLQRRVRSVLNGNAALRRRKKVMLTAGILSGAAAGCVICGVLFLRKK